MTEQLSQIEKKITNLLDKFDSLKGDNATLRLENKNLKEEVAKLSQDFNALKITQNDQANQVKTKLTSVLSRIEELEKIGL